MKWHSAVTNKLSIESHSTGLDIAHSKRFKVIVDKRKPLRLFELIDEREPVMYGEFVGQFYWNDGICYDAVSSSGHFNERIRVDVCIDFNIKTLLDCSFKKINRLLSQTRCAFIFFYFIAQKETICYYPSCCLIKIIRLIAFELYFIILNSIFNETWVGSL